MSIDVDDNTVSPKDAKVARNQAAIAWCRKNQILPLSKHEKWVWSIWLPQHFVLGSNTGEGDWNWARYEAGLDMEVQGILSEIADSFSELEVRSKENRTEKVAEHALFGHIDHPGGKRDTVLIKRWNTGVRKEPLPEDDVWKIVQARTQFIRYFFPSLSARIQLYTVGISINIAWWLLTGSWVWPLGIALVWSGVFVIDSLVKGAAVGELRADLRKLA